MPLSELSDAGLRSLAAPQAAGPSGRITTLADHPPDPGARSSTAGSQLAGLSLRCPVFLRMRAPAALLAACQALQLACSGIRTSHTCCGLQHYLAASSPAAFS